LLNKQFVIAWLVKETTQPSLIPDAAEIIKQLKRWRLDNQTINNNTSEMHILRKTEIQDPIGNSTDFALIFRTVQLQYCNETSNLASILVV
jgi:hypothetical protein